MAITKIPTEFRPFEVLNPNKAWCAKEVDRLLDEWRAWGRVVENLGDSPDYNPNTCTEAIKDGSDTVQIISGSTKF